MTAAERRRLGDAIRSAIERSSMTRYEIAKRSGITQATLSRFVNGRSSLSVDSIEMLAPVLGLEITTKKKRTKKS